MELVYSATEARARFSEVLRHVREGKTVTLSYRGAPVAEIRPLSKKPPTLEARVAELERQGSIVPPVGPPEPFTPGPPLPGTLAEFLAERGDSVAEMRPLKTSGGSGRLEDRFAELERKGALTPAPSHREPMKPGPRVPGALARFLADR